MSLEYIREYYGVPAKKGMRVTYRSKAGVITGASGPHVRVRLDGEKSDGCYHPTDLMYIPGIVFKASPDAGKTDPSLFIALLREQQAYHWVEFGLACSMGNKALSETHLAMHDKIKAALGDES